MAEFLFNGKIPREQTTIVGGGYGIARAYTRRYQFGPEQGGGRGSPTRSLSCPSQA